VIFLLWIEATELKLNTEKSDINIICK